MIDFPHKIIVPQRPAYLVTRPRLIESLMSIRHRQLITLSAPAGYGKTSLLTDFASVLTDLPVCWYTLDRFDEDPWVFLDYLATSIAQRFPGATKATMAALDGRARTPFSTAAATLVRDVYAISSDFVLVIDDWHLVDQIAEIGDVVAQLLLHCPRCHLILASRIYPSLTDLMLLAARRQLSGLDEEHLRFTAPEIAEVLGAEYHVTIPDAEAQTLAEQSNGWITGVLLAAQVTGPAVKPDATPDARAERFIYRYLAEQVFDLQPALIRDFLLQSSLLEELTPQRCDSMFDRNDSGTLLNTLLRQHLFITEIRPGVLRYHPLFREFLQEHLRTTDPQQYRVLALRVAEGYAAQGQWSLAFESCVLADNLTAAQSIAARGGTHLYTSGRLETLDRWFSVLPHEQLDAPLLCLKARVLIDHGQLHEAQAAIDLATVRTRPEEEAGVLLQQASLARVSGRYAQAIEVGEQALRIVSDDAERAMVLRVLATSRHRLGESKQAIDELQAALVIERQRGDLYAMALVKQDLGVCYEELGQLATAEEYYTQADAYWATIGNTGRRAITLNNKAVIQHLQGNYVEAYVTLQTALQYACDTSMVVYQAMILASLGDLYSDLQLWEQADEAYREAVTYSGVTEWRSYVELAFIRLHIRQRQYELATQRLQQISEETRLQADGQLDLLAGEIAFGNGQYIEAAAYAQAAIVTLEDKGLRVHLARAYLLQAKLATISPPVDQYGLLRALEAARMIGEQLGHDAFLVAETFGMRQMLRHARSLHWPYADSWLQRHSQLTTAARHIIQHNQLPTITVRTLDADQISIDGTIVELGWRKAREIFYYLLAHPNGALSDTLRDVFWPDLDTERSRGALKTAIYQLRTTLPPNLIVQRDRRVYQINRAAAYIDYDVDRLLDLLNRHDDPEAIFEAIELYRGPYLGWSDYDWSNTLRRQIEQRYLQALRAGANGCEQRHMFADALLIYTQIIAIESLDEAAHAGLMRCHIALGNRAAAVAQYHTLRHVLDAELGLDVDSTSEAEQVYRRMLATS